VLRQRVGVGVADHPWKEGTPDDWAREAFDIAYDDVYGQPPLSGALHRDAEYVET
jgi:hypothetical protein